MTQSIQPKEELLDYSCFLVEDDDEEEEEMEEDGEEDQDGE